MKVTVEKYIKQLVGSTIHPAPSISFHSRQSSHNSAISTRIRLAERKAKLEAEIKYNERLNKLENEGLEVKRKRREADLEKLQMEQEILEKELVKLDHIADYIENLNIRSSNERR